MSRIIKPSKMRSMIQRSLKLMKPRKDEAARFQRAYLGDYGLKPRSSIDDMQNKDEMAVNYVYGYVETAGPAIYSGTPRIILEEHNEISKSTKDNAQATVNYWFRETGARKHFSQARFDSFFGPAAILTLWDFQEKIQEVPVLGPFDPIRGQPTIVGTKKEMVVIKDQPMIRRVNPWNVILDPDSEMRSDDRFRGWREAMPLELFMELPGVGSKMKEQIKEGVIPKDMNRGPYSDVNEWGADGGWVTVTHIYDLQNEKVLMLPDGQEVDDYAEAKDWPWDMEYEDDRFPLTILEGKPDALNPYSCSEFLAFWSQINERNRIRTAIQAHTRRQHPGWIHQSGAVDEDEIDKFVRARIGESVPMKNPDAIKIRPLPDVPADFYNFDKMSKDDLDNTSGAWEFNGGNIADTATEASLLETKGSVRKNERKAEFEANLIAPVGAKVLALCQQYMDEAVAIKIKSPKSPRDTIWLNATKEDIQGEFGFTVKPGNTVNKNENMKRQQTLKFAEIMAGNPHVDQRALAVELSETFDFDPDKILKPMEEVQAEMENAGKGDKKPPLTFSSIKTELLPPEVQAAVLQAAMQQNGVQEMDMGAANGGAISPDNASSMNMPPPNNSVMPGAEMSQPPPPLPEADMPPITPVQPASEFQGGIT